MFDRKFFRGKVTVKEIQDFQKKNCRGIHKKHENIIVFRALDEDTAEHEKQIAEDRDLKDNIRKTVGISEAIVISDSEDEADNRQGSNGARGNRSSNTSNSDGESDDEVAEIDMNTQYKSLGAYTSGNASIGPQVFKDEHQTGLCQQFDDVMHREDHATTGNRMDEDNGAGEEGESMSDEDGDAEEDQGRMNGNPDMVDQLQNLIRDDHTTEDYQLLMDADQLDPASYQLMVESGQLQYIRPSNTEDAAQTLLDFSINQQLGGPSVDNTLATSITPNPLVQLQIPAQALPAFVPASNLLPSQRELLNDTAWYNCASPHCQRQMVIKPWTYYSTTTLEPLCTECTRVFLRDPVLNTDAGALEHLEKLVNVHNQEKERRQNIGNPQNSDEDAPFDYPRAMRGPIALSEYTPIASKQMDNMENSVTPPANVSNDVSHDSTNSDATIGLETNASHMSSSAGTSSPPNEVKRGLFSSTFSRFTNIFRSPPKDNTLSSSTEGRSELQSPAYTNTVTGASTLMQEMLNDSDNTTADYTNNPTAHATTSDTSDFDTNIDDLIDEDSFAADPNRVHLAVVAQDQDEESIGETEEEDEEEEDQEIKQERDAAEYHAAMVQEVKVYDDESDEYMDD